jgi:GntR family transcriptional repressor for pyruvate dehydrogenase complex
VPRLSLRPFVSDARGSGKVADQLTEAIISKQIRAGECLPSERELADQFRVSPTVIREAVRSLADRRLVRLTSGGDAEVNQVGFHHSVATALRLFVRGHERLDYSSVSEIRIAVEILIAGLAAQRAQPEHLQRLTQICDEHQHRLKQGDLKEASESDFQFHQELARSADNELLLAMLEPIAEVLREIRLQSMADPHVGEEGLRAHRDILKCVKSKDVKAAREAMAEHLAEAERVWLGTRTRHRSPRTPKTRRSKR